MPRETYSALAASLFLCCNLDMGEVRHIAASSMICLQSSIMAMQELNTWEEIAKFLAWASCLFSVASVAFRSADSEGSYELPNPLPFLERYYTPPGPPCPMMTQLDRGTERREGDVFSRFSVATRLVQRLIPHAVEEDLGYSIQIWNVMFSLGAAWLPFSCFKELNA